jgi:hypothetical protein
MAAANPPDAVHSVPKIPNERNVPRLGVITSDKTLRTRPMLSGGKNCVIIVRAWSKRLGTGKNATMADKKMREGKSDRTK